MTGHDADNNPERTGHEHTATKIGREGETKILGVCGGIGSGKSTACKLMVDSLGCVASIDADMLAHAVYRPGSKASEEIISEFGRDVVLPRQHCQISATSDDEEEEYIVEIDRKKLGSIVFSNAAAMSKLEEIVWPHVRTKIEERIKDIIMLEQQQQQQHQSSDANAIATASNTKNNIIVVEAALLLETDWHDLFDGLWVIQSTCEVAKRRMVETRGMTEDEALVRIRAQDTRRGIGRKLTNSSGDDNDAASNANNDEICNELKDGVVTAIVTNDGSLDDLEEALRRALYDPTSFKKRGG
jgi:dephospho-CoA kinase